MNTMKKNGGFTLVELIIVIAILAILSTAAIAGYSTYINSANDAAVQAVLSDISTSAVLANAAAGGIKEIDVTVTADGTITVAITPEISFDDVDDAFNTNFTTSLKAINATLADNDQTDAREFTVVIDRLANSPEFKTGATWSASSWEGK